ncbi:hypothetical protein WJX75_006696 [Coccomyxa subellipsoidea]|uniref:Anaphase-promoting complex subunit 4 n=1 Tax=Coccomyxa subellipsoidea TaxID=248742 RepID=A0ABR2YQH2_9CHLO
MAFTQLLDRGLTSDVVLASWCPTMDLLALVMSDSQLSVNRLNKQRLWVLAPDSKITAITWQPDGKILAIALQAGGIWLLDVENGPGDKGTFSPDGHAPGLPDLPSRLSVLCAADDSAAVRLLAFGSFSLGRAAMPGADACRAQQPPAPCLMHAEMTRDLSRLCTVSVIKATGQVGCVIHDTSCIGQRCAELRRIAVFASHVTSLLKWCGDALAAAQKEWRDAMAAVDAKMEEFRVLLVSYGTAASAEEELLGILATGALTPAMMHFLTAILGEANLKRLARAVDAAVGSVGRILVEHVQCSLEAVALQLGDALGLARCSPWMDPLTLQEAAVGEAAAAAQALVLRAEALRRAVVDVGAHYRLLFAWMLTLCRRLNEDALPPGTSPVAFRADPHALAAFIRGPFRRDAVGPQLSCEGPEAVPPLQAERPGMRTLLELFGCGAGGAAEGTSLRHGLAVLTQQCRGVLGCAQHSMGPSMQPLLSVCLATLCQPSHRLTVTLPQLGSTVARMCFLAEPCQEGQAQSLLFVDICGASNEEQGQLQVVSTVADVEGWGNIADVAFYKDKHLAVLTGSGGDMEEAQFVLLPMYAVPGASTGQVGEQAGRVRLGIEGLAKRGLGYAQAAAPLAVSGPRGVACTAVGLQRIVLLDLEEEENEADLSEGSQSEADD